MYFIISPTKNILEVIYLQYDNLQSLLKNSSSTRRYFQSLPVDMQLKIHKQNEYIHSAEQLHYIVYSIDNLNEKPRKQSF